MSSLSSFQRKIIYLAAIALLLYPLHWLSQPSTVSTKDSPGSPGGVLARLREENDMSQAQLGEIDPTSVAVKLATLGLRGVAADILWAKANDYKMKKDWTNFGATLKQITKIQPNFINVWRNQAWNLSYNISAEFDDYRDRYRWVIKGLDFLKEGIKYNAHQPRLQWEMGMMISQKIGKADEHKQFRKLFKDDDDFNGSLPRALRDNWLVGKTWYEKAVEMVETLGMRMMGQSPLIYLSSAPMCQMYYAESLEKDGTFGQVAEAAWAEAARQWRLYANREIPTSYRREDKPDEPVMIRLGDLESEEATLRKLLARLDALEPGLRRTIVAEKRATLSESQREAIDTPMEKRTGNQAQLAMQAEPTVAVTNNEVALRIQGPKRKEALELAKKIDEHQQLATYIRRYRGIVNFDYWKMRAEAEQTPEMLKARQYTYEGDQNCSEGLLIPTRDAYRKAMIEWRKVLDAYPKFVTDQTLGDDLSDVVQRYRRVLGQLDESFPKDFILQDVLDAQTKLYGAAPPTENQSEKPAENQPENK